MLHLNFTLNVVYMCKLHQILEILKLKPNLDIIFGFFSMFYFGNQTVSLEESSMCNRVGKLFVIKGKINNFFAYFVVILFIDCDEYL